MEYPTLKEAKLILIMDCLNYHGGHRIQTAKALGISVRSLGVFCKKQREEGNEFFITGNGRLCHSPVRRKTEENFKEEFNPLPSKKELDRIRKMLYPNDIVSTI